ncbi:hypothetical protein [Enterobacter cloacae complex sp. 2025EL-00065]|uniref:hypothetical protein n=1 Tax=Enterobacteriaceae TaxID=543 RepID=UPI0037865304|nr:hypothetical protein [Klebsiella quasipneumoniae subsp. similipneumoniae]
MNYTKLDLKAMMKKSEADRQACLDKVKALREKFMVQSDEDIATFLGLPVGVTNLAKVSNDTLIELLQMQQRAEYWTEKYVGTVISGENLANLADRTVEDIYVQDIEKYSSVAIEWHHNIFLSVDFDKVQVGIDLSNTLVYITNISLGRGKACDTFCIMF